MESPKGSKLQMQKISADENRNVLESLLGQELEILCPINFKEYQLNNKEMLDKLGLVPSSFNGFWPNRQPQWDGIALGKKDNTLFLIEAKAHLSEIGSGNTPPKSTDSSQKKANFETIRTTLLKEKDHYSSEVDEKVWLHRFYQIANRLAFLRKTIELSNNTTKYNQVKLVFLNFTNDPYWLAKNLNATENDWRNKYHDIWIKMGISEAKLRDNILILCVDAQKLK